MKLAIGSWFLLCRSNVYGVGFIVVCGAYDSDVHSRWRTKIWWTVIGEGSMPDIGAHSHNHFTPVLLCYTTAHNHIPYLSTSHISNRPKPIQVHTLAPPHQHAPKAPPQTLYTQSTTRKHVSNGHWNCTHLILEVGLGTPIQQCLHTLNMTM